MRVPNCGVQIPAHTYLEVKIEMIWSETNISIRCLKCGELFFQSGIQRDDEYTRYRCGCDGDIEIDDESLIEAEFARQLKEDRPTLYKQLVHELFGDGEDE